jgi:hypothetical protein
MSKMGQFVFECQEIAENNYNEPVAVVKAKVWDEFDARPEIRSFAYDTTIRLWEEIQTDLRKVG